MLRGISRSFNDLNISLRLGLGFGILVLLVLLVGVAPFTAANIQAQQTVRILQSATVVLALLLGVGMVALVSRRLTRQMDEIDKVFQAAATGDFDARAQVLSRDELGRTAEGINAMLAQLSSLTALGGRPPQAALEHAPVLFCLRDAQGKFMDVNPTLAALFGLTPEQVIGKATHDLVDDKAGADVSVAHDRQVFETGEPLTTEESGFLRGERLTFLVNRFPLRDAEGNIYAVGSIGTDITEQAALRKRAERSGAQLRAMLEHTPAPFGLKDARGVYTDVNPAFAALFGLLPEQVIGKTIYDLVEDKEAADVAAAYDRQVLETGEHLTMEESGVLGSERLTFLGNRFPLRDAEGNIYAIGDFGLNITERVRAEEALRESEEKYRTLVERANDGIIIIQDGIILYGNPRLAEIWGGMPGETIGTPFTDYIHPDELPKVADRYRRRMAGEDVPSVYETTLIRKDGSKVHVELHAGLITYQGKPADLVMVRDITERVRTEEALRESEEKYRSLVENSLQGLAVIQEDRIVFANSTAAEMLGTTADVLLSLSPDEIRAAMYPEDREIAWGRLQDRLEGKPIPPRYEFRIVRRDGSVRWLELFSSRIQYQGKPAAQIAFMDSTERKRAEEALRQRTERLRILRELDQAILAAESPEAVAQAALSHIRRLVPCSRGSVVAFDMEADQTLILDAQANGETRLGARVSIPLEEYGITEELREGGIHVVEDTHLLPQLSLTAEILRDEGIRAYASVPLIYRGKLIGALNLGTDTPGTFAPDHLDIAREVADALAIAIQQARLHEEIQARSRYLETLQRINATLRSTLPLSEVLETVAQGAGKALDYVGTLILVPDATGERLTVGAAGDSRLLDETAKITGAEVASFSLPLAAEENPMAKAYLSGEMQSWIWAPERVVVGVEPSISPRLAPTIARAIGARATACIPLPVGEKVVGVLVVFSPREQFPEEERAVLLGLADQAGLAIEHAQLYESLRESEERYRTLFESSPESIFLIGSDGRVIDCNNATEVLSGISKEEITGKPFAELGALSEEDLPQIMAAFTRLLNEEDVQPIEVQITTRGGDLRLLEAHPVLLKKDDKVWAIQIVGRDITERKRAEEALRESEERFSTVFRLAPMGIAVLRAADTRFVEVNDYFVKKTGYTREEIIGRTAAELQLYASPGGRDPGMQALQEQGLLETFELRARNKSGEVEVGLGATAEISLSGEMHYLSMVIDITKRKRAEEALRESEERYRRLVELSPEAIAIHSEGEIVYANAAAIRLIGAASPEELIGKPIWGLIHPDYLESVRGRIQRTTEGREPTDLVGEKLVRLDGQVIDVETIGAPITYMGKPAVQVIVRDITERKRAEEAIRQHNRELAALNAVSTVVSQSLDLDEILNAGLDKALELMRLDVGGVYLVDPVNLRLNLAVHRGVSSQYVDEVRSINVDEKSVEVAMAQGRLGSFTLPVEAVIRNRAELKRIKSVAQREGLSLTSVVQVLLQAKEEIVGAMVVASREPRQYSEAELQLLTSIGQQIAVAIYNARLYEAEQYERVLAQTLQRSAETLVRSARLEDTLPHIVDQLEAAVQFDHAMVMLSEGSHLRVVEARGFPDQAQMIERSYYYPDIPLLHASLTSDEPVVVEDARSDPRWVEPPDGIISRGGWLGARLVVWETVMGLLCIGTHEPSIYDAQDVEAVAAFANQAAFALEHARIIEELEDRVSDLQETQGYLVRAARLSAAGEIATGVAHQINNPLTAVIAESDLLLSEIEPNSPGYESAVAISEAAERAGAVAQRLLDLARLGPISMQPVDVNRSLQSAISLVRAQVEPSIRLVTVLAPNLPLIQANRERLEDAWINLLLNAKDAIGEVEGGVIRVSSAPDVEGIKVTIQDNGVGIPPEHIDRVFDPFFTTKAYGRGTGLGLSICYDVVDRHNGSINVESKEGQGATFVVTLPLNPGELKPDHP